MLEYNASFSSQVSGLGRDLLPTWNGRGAKLKVFIHPWCLGGTDVDAVLPRHSR